MTRPTALGVLALAAALGFTAPVPNEDKLPPPTAEQLRASASNLKQIGLAVHNYESTNATLPNNILDKDGKPLLSWRVVLAPYLEVADKGEGVFKLDEPWDSEHNKKLIEKMPKVFAPVRVKAPAGHTFYRGFVGEGTVFEAGKKLRIGDITDGLSNTALVVEAGESVPWTKPDDLPFDPKKDLPKLGGLFDGEFHVLLGDGSVRRAKKDFDAAAFRALVTRNGGEVFEEGSVFIKPKK